jgi:hypothetical protein
VQVGRGYGGLQLATRESAVATPPACRRRNARPIQGRRVRLATAAAAAEAEGGL